MNVHFDALTRYVQIRQGAIAITGDERVYLVRGGGAIELVPDPTASDETPLPGGVRMVVGAISGEGD